MIKIAYITTENPFDVNNNGGIGTYTGIIAKGMARIGHQVHCITVGNNKDQEIEKNLLLHNVSISDSHSTLYIENMTSFAKKIKEIQSNYGIDIIESPEWMAQGLLLSYSSKLTLVTRLHTPLFLIEDILDGQKIYRKSEDIKKSEKEQAKNSCGVTAPCTAMSMIVADKWGVESKVIPNPIDISEFDLRAKNNVDIYEGPFLLFMGRLEYRKGALVLAECLKQILPCHPNLKVIFCGQDTLYKKKSIKSRILEICKSFEERLSFITHAKFEEKVSLMRQSSLIVLPSIWENFSYVALEAMCMGKTIVASNVGGYSEMIEDGISGHLVETNSPTALALKINLILNGELCNTGVGARKRVRENFDINILCYEFEKYYFSIIK